MSDLLFTLAVLAGFLVFNLWVQIASMEYCDRKPHVAYPLYGVLWGVSSYGVRVWLDERVTFSWWFLLGYAALFALVLGFAKGGWRWPRRAVAPPSA
jgi:hypothetical protein